MCISNLVFKTGFGRHDKKLGILIKRNLPILLGDYVFELFDFIEGKRDELLEEYPHRVLRMKADDDSLLKGYFFNPKVKSDKLAILVHGYNSKGLGDHVLSAKYYLDKGYNVFLTANRGCDISGGKYTGFGILEKNDTLKWVNRFCTENPNYEIVLQGVSLGGATVCMMSRLNLPINVKCIVADCPFKTLKDQLYQSAKVMHLPTFMFNKLNKICIKKAEYSFYDDSPLDAVKEAKVPMFFVHGDKDDFIPKENSEELYEACVSEDKKLLIISGAAHGSSNYIDYDKYYTELGKFVDKYIQ